MTEQEEFEFRERFEREQAKSKPGEIPRAGPYVAPASTGKMAGEPSYTEKMTQYATAVPAAGLVAGGLRAATAGTKAAPYAARAAEAFIPKTLGGLTAATGVAGLSAIPAEFSRRQAEKRGAGPVGQTLAEMVGGGAVAVPGLLGQRAASDLASKLSLARGTEVKPLIERLGKTATERAAQTVETAKSAEVKPLKELTSIESAQERLAKRLPVAEQRQATREQSVESALNTLSPSKKVLAEDVGGIIQPLGQRNIKQLAGERTRQAITEIKDPAFSDAVAREQSGDFIATNDKSRPLLEKAIDVLKRQIEDTTEPYRSQLKARMESLMGEQVPLSQAEQRVEQLRATSIPGYQPKTTKAKPMTLGQAEFMRRMLTDKQLAESSGFAALDINRRQEVAKALSDAMKTYEPRISDYLSKYRELSAPIEKATAGRGAALTEADLLAEQEVLFAADKKAATNYYLDGSQERAERLLSLVGGKNKQLVDGIKAYFRNEMEGMSSKQTKDFIAKNEGLLRVFPELKPQMESVAQAKSVAETAPKAATQKAEAAAQRLGTQQRGAERRVQQTQEERRKYEGLQQNILNAAPGKEVQAAETFVDTLYKDKKIDKVEYSNLLEQIRAVQQAAKSQKEAKQQLHTLLVRLGWGVGGVGAAGTLGYLF